MKTIRIIGIVIAALVLSVAGIWFYYEQIGNPRVVRVLTEHPNGERAQKVMLLTLPSGRRIPVNYLREADRVFAGADGSWWKELDGVGLPVEVWIRGETLTGRARAVLDDPAYTKAVFARLRPDAVEGFGVLVDIRLDAGPASRK